MQITRRQFVKMVTASAAALGISQAEIFKMTEALARDTGSIAAPKVVWLTGALCGGCITSVLQVAADIDLSRNFAVTPSTDNYIYYYGGVADFTDVPETPQVAGTADASTTTTLTDNALVQAAGYWIGATLVITSGVASGQYRTVTGFDATSDSLTFATIAGLTGTVGYRLLQSLAPTNSNVTGTVTAAPVSYAITTPQTEANDFWVGSVLIIETGLGAGQVRRVTGSRQTGGLLAVDTDWVVTPNGTSTYRLLRPAVAQYHDTAAMDMDGTTTFEEVVLEVLNLQTHAVAQGMGGATASQIVKTYFNSYVDGSVPGYPKNSGGFVLLVEGAIPEDEFCKIGDTRDNAADTADGSIGISLAVKEIAKNPDCKAVIGVGTCGSFGGIPGGRNLKATGTQFRRTNAMGAQAYCASVGVPAYPTGPAIVNVPGCPVQPEVLVLTILDAMLTLNLGPAQHKGTHVLLASGELDSDNRPTAYFGKILHLSDKDYSKNPPTSNEYGCPRFQKHMERHYAVNPGDTGCLMYMGCKGLTTNTPCGTYGWCRSASTTNPYPDKKKLFCTANGMPCYGCMEKGYPDKNEPFIKL